MSNMDRLMDLEGINQPCALELWLVHDTQGWRYLDRPQPQDRPLGWFNVAHHPEGLATLKRHFEGALLAELDDLPTLLLIYEAGQGGQPGLYEIAIHFPQSVQERLERWVGELAIYSEREAQGKGHAHRRSFQALSHERMAHRLRLLARMLAASRDQPTPSCPASDHHHSPLLPAASAITPSDPHSTF